MTPTANIPNTLNEDYELTIAMINANYDNYPTALVEIQISDGEIINDAINASTAEIQEGLR